MSSNCSQWLHAFRHYLLGGGAPSAGGRLSDFDPRTDNQALAWLKRKACSAPTRRTSAGGWLLDEIEDSSFEATRLPCGACAADPTDPLSGRQSAAAPSRTRAGRFWSVAAIAADRPTRATRAFRAGSGSPPAADCARGCCARATTADSGDTLGPARQVGVTAAAPGLLGSAPWSLAWAGATSSARPTAARVPTLRRNPTPAPSARPRQRPQASRSPPSRRLRYQVSISQSRLDAQRRPDALEAARPPLSWPHDDRDGWLSQYGVTVPAPPRPAAAPSPLWPAIRCAQCAGDSAAA